MGSNAGDNQYVANKTFTMAGVEYKPGDPVDMGQLPGHKVSQFLNQRRIRPVPAEVIKAAK